MAEMQEATGLNFIFDRLNACVSSVKQTLELYYRKMSLSEAANQGCIIQC